MTSVTFLSKWVGVQWRGLRLVPHATFIFTRPQSQWVGPRANVLHHGHRHYLCKAAGVSHCVTSYMPDSHKCSEEGNSLHHLL